jgi:hypothetical protein
LFWDKGIEFMHVVVAVEVVWENGEDVYFEGVYVINT